SPMPAGRGPAADSAAATAPLQAWRGSGRTGEPPTGSSSAAGWARCVLPIQIDGNGGYAGFEGVCSKSHTRRECGRESLDSEPVVLVAADAEHVGPPARRVDAGRAGRIVRGRQRGLRRILGQGGTNGQKPNATNEITNHL